MLAALAGAAPLAGFATLLTLALVGGSTKSELITLVGGSTKSDPPQPKPQNLIRTEPAIIIHEPRVIHIEPLPPRPNLGDRPLFPPRDFVPIGDKTQIVDRVVEVREIALWCGGYELSINPMTSVAYITYSWTGRVRSHAAIDPHSIVVGVADGTMRIDRDNNTYSLSVSTGAPKLIGICTPMP